MRLSAAFAAGASGLAPAAALAAALAGATPAGAQTVGPYDAEITAAGGELTRPAGPDQSGAATAEWTVQAWVEPRGAFAGDAAIAAFGDAADGVRLSLKDGRAVVSVGGRPLSGGPALGPGQWTLVAAVNDGSTLRLYVDGHEVAQGPAAPVSGSGPVHIASRGVGNSGFAGRIAGLRLSAGAITPEDIARQTATLPKPALITFDTNSPHWPVQVRQMYGQVSPQPAWTLPQGAPADAPVARPESSGPALQPHGAGLWNVAGWRLAGAPQVDADGAALSQPGFDAHAWYAATVPGTVLTTLVDRGVYPAPEIGLNNLAIPESLARQDWWYRSQFDAPAEAAGRRLDLTFKGVNYSAEVWLNGVRVGGVKGAFIRGRFDVTSLLRPGRNAIAVKVSPPPHPGLAQEESLTAGVGENGGMQMLDGPTFEATEGWDWIPSIRDRNIGLWQGVELRATGDVRLGDPQVVTTLPRPDNSVADIEIDAPLQNLSDHPVQAELAAAFDDVRVVKAVTVAPGATAKMVLSPADYAQLHVQHPKLWWPNGYGAPDLHTLHLSVSAGGEASDSRDVRFGMRQVTYDISLVDHGGGLQRVNVDLTKARALGLKTVAGSHEDIRKVSNGWAYSFAPGAEASPAVTPVSGEEGLSPYLVLRVNGVRIAARGGSVGMDDLMKRVSRERLEPFFRLHRDAHLNIVRNWMGQDTEENFYALADEYGLMILNDFWESTQDYNIEAQDEPLFLANAKDVVDRFRNHPSIVVWFGRNEGVPQPLLNEGMRRMFDAEDGTRLYMGSSNRISLQDSGPYNWRPPAEYFTTDAKGFAVELGTPSFPTLESWERAVPKSQLWPISDTWAYHDWHQAGNGAVASFMDAMTARYGAATGLDDFERKAQMLEYDSYRAIFEGFNAGLWKTNSARMLWMTQPAWPSSAWQIFSSDYDTHAAFYGVQHAAEPVHVQMNLPDHEVIVIDNTQAPVDSAVVEVRVTALDGRILAIRTTTVSAAAASTVDALKLDLEPILAAQGVVLVELQLRDRKGGELSRNVYWQARDDSAYRAMTTMPQAPLTLHAAAHPDGAETVVAVELANAGKTPALTAKLTLFDMAGKQILPAYFSDNYVSLLPGERRTVLVRYPGSLGRAGRVDIRGWNVAPGSAPVARDAGR